MSLDNLLEQYRKKNIVPDRPSMAATVDRAENVFALSEKEKIPTSEADSILLSQELIDYNKKLVESPLYQKMDGLIDVFDPSEPPAGGEGVPDPMGELLRYEIAAMKEPVKWATKAMSYIYAPIDRGFKFVTNALMYDPLTKSVSGIVKKEVISAALQREYTRLAHQKRAGMISQDEEIEKRQELNKLANEAIRQLAAEETEGVEVADFLKSGKDALKSLVPWPGYADDVKKFGEISADSYERIVGKEAPWWYPVLGDIALETTAMVGLMKMSQSATTAKDATALAAGAKLTKKEVDAIKKLHKAASQVKKTPVKAIGVPSKEEALTATQKLIQLIREARPLRDRKALLLHKDRQEKARKLLQVQETSKGQDLSVLLRGH